MSRDYRGGGPAFPRAGHRSTEDDVDNSEPGMSKLEWYAGLAMQRLMDHRVYTDPSEIAKKAHEQGAAMVAEGEQWGRARHCDEAMADCSHPEMELRHISVDVCLTCGKRDELESEFEDPPCGKSGKHSMLVRAPDGGYRCPACGTTARAEED